MNWYSLAIMSWVFMGSQRFLYKVSAERRCNTHWTTFSFMATVALLSSCLYLFRGGPVGAIGFLVGVSLVNSLSFLIATMAHIEALKYLPTGVVYPIIRLSAVIVVLFSIVYFRDPLTVWQGVGIVLAMIVIVVLTRDLHPDKGKSAFRTNRGIVLVVVSLVAGAVASISSKFAAMSTDTLAYIALSYGLSTLFSFGIRVTSKTKRQGGNLRESAGIGIAMGFINLAGYYTLLKALAAGPLSIIASIVGMHFVIAVVLARIIYKETLTRTRVIGILLTLFSIVLLRL